MRGVHVVLDAHPLRRARVAGGHQAHDLVLEQHRQVHAVWRLGPVADHHVQVPFRERALEVEAGPERVQAQARLRRLAAEALGHAGDEHRRQVVGRADAELVPGAMRLEGLRRVGHAVDLGKRPLGVRHQGERTLGRHHAALLPHQQRIAEDLAQALQGRAHRGLRLVQAQRGARHAALGDQEHEHAQQVGVERVVAAPQAHGGSPRPCRHVAPGRHRPAATGKIRESIYHI